MVKKRKAKDYRKRIVKFKHYTIQILQSITIILTSYYFFKRKAKSCGYRIVKFKHYTLYITDIAIIL